MAACEETNSYCSCVSLYVSIRIMQIRGYGIRNFCIIYIKLKVCHFQFMHITRKHAYTLIVSSTLQPYMLLVYKAMNVKGKLCGNGVAAMVSPFSVSIGLAYWNVSGNCGFIIQIAHELVSLISFDRFVFYERFSLKVKALSSRKPCT